MRAGPLSRALASGLDLASGLTLGVLLAPGPLGEFFSARAVVLLRIGEPDSWFVGPVAMVIGILGELVFLLPLAVMLALAPEALGGAALGKLLLRLRIETVEGLTRRWRLATRYLVKTLPLQGTVVALLTGVWAIQVVVLLLAAVLLSEVFIASLRGTRGAHDRLAGTIVRSLSGG